MKILFVTEFYWPNLDGAALFERRLAGAMAKRGHQVAVWAPASRLRSYVETDGEMKVFREASLPLLGKTRYRVTVWPFRHAFKILRRERPDIIHVHNCTQIGVAAVLAAKVLRIPIIATNHAMPQNVIDSALPSWLQHPLSNLIWSYIVWFLNRADFVTTPTPIALSYLKQHGLKRPASDITNGLDLTHFKPAPTKSKTPTLLYVGRIDREKNLRVMLEAAAIMKPKAELKVNIAGVGTEIPNLKKLARKLGVDDIVKILGEVSESKKLSLLHQATVFVMPSPAELQSISTMEAMACAKPVIAADAGALPNLIKSGRNGLLFPYRDAYALAEKAMEVIASPQLQRRFGEANLATMRRNHTAELSYKEYERAYGLAIKQSAKQHKPQPA